MRREEVSDEEIIERFRKLFNRVMTPEEKKCFLLPIRSKQTERDETDSEHRSPTAT